MFSRRSLALRFLLVVLLIISIMAVSVYFYSVPLIKSKVYEIELNAAKLALDNIYDLADKSYANLEGFREQTLDANKMQLQAMVELTSSQLESTLALAKRHGVSEEEGRRALFSSLRDFTYGNKGYIWVVSDEGEMLSHPDDRYDGKRISSLEAGESAIIGKMVKAAITDGEGFYQYKWHRLDSTVPDDKLSYVKNFPEWRLMIGSGLYLDDMESAVHARKTKAIEDIRQALAGIRIAQTGYLFIIDKEGQLIAHPNKNLDKKNATNLIDPASGRPIVQELIEVADSGRELHYRWDRPDEPGAYDYDKLSIVRRMASFDWYICATVYVDELQKSANILTHRIVTITGFTFILTALLATYFTSLISQPIRQLARTADKVRRGDFTATSGIHREDEIGTLAQTFDTMVRRLHGSIRSLDQRVTESTEELAILEERQRLILDALPAQIAYLNRKLEYVFVNEGYAQQFSLDKAQVLGKHIEVVVGDDMMRTISPALQQCLEGEAISYEYSFQRGDRMVVTKRQLIPADYAGAIDGILVLSLDITHEKEAERRLLEAQRMQATGQLAGGLAHDFNNLLTIILGNLGKISEQVCDPVTQKHHIDPALRATRRGAEITSRLLAFSRRLTLSPATTGLETLLAETVLLLRSSLPDGVTLECECLDDPVLFIDITQLENTLINLVLNARDAIDGAGCIRIRAAVSDAPDGEAFDEPVRAGRYIRIDVYDTGPGFSDSALVRAFEPFFTTKQANSSGLGLSMVFGFVKQTGGYLRVANQVADGGRVTGACVSLLLPGGEANDDCLRSSVTTLLAKRRLAANPESGQLASAGGSRLVLLAEDDDDLRQLVRQWLVAMGYVVIEAVSADEAEKLLGQLQEVALLISDVSMPGSIDGLALANRCASQQPDLPVLLISGFSFDADVATSMRVNAEGGVLQRRHYLSKPFEQSALERAIAFLMPSTKQGGGLI